MVSNFMLRFYVTIVILKAAAEIVKNIKIVEALL